jgi:hypothetical protein
VEGRHRSVDCFGTSSTVLFKNVDHFHELGGEKKHKTTKKKNTQTKKWDLK